MLKRHLMLTTIGGVMLAATAMAQTSAPNATPPSPATAPAPAKDSAKPAPTNLAMPGKWRASKLMGVDIYGPDDKKVGDVTEVVFDKSGKIETVTIGVGGFLGIGSKDVAVPFEQVTWSDMPMAKAAPAPAGGASGTAPAPMAAAPAPKAPNMYPDHGKITLTKEQLTAAPAVTYSASM